MTFVDERSTKTERWKQGARCQSCDASIKYRDFTNGVGTINGEEKDAKTETMGDGNLAIDIEGLDDGNVVQGREHTLRAESLSGADSRDDLFGKSTPFGNILESKPKVRSIQYTSKKHARA
jgi:hypothetical protein